MRRVCHGVPGVRAARPRGPRPPHNAARAVPVPVWHAGWGRYFFDVISPYSCLSWKVRAASRSILALCVGVNSISSAHLHVLPMPWGVRVDELTKSRKPPT